jgi:hypothetical protein
MSDSHVKLAIRFETPAPGIFMPESVWAISKRAQHREALGAGGRQRIDRDLEEDRPPSIPHTYEKLYGI